MSTYLSVRQTYDLRRQWLFIICLGQLLSGLTIQQNLGKFVWALHSYLDWRLYLEASLLFFGLETWRRYPDNPGCCPSTGLHLPKLLEFKHAVKSEQSWFILGPLPTLSPRWPTLSFTFSEHFVRFCVDVSDNIRTKVSSVFGENSVRSSLWRMVYRLVQVKKAHSIVSVKVCQY